MTGPASNVPEASPLGAVAAVPAIRAKIALPIRGRDSLSKTALPSRRFITRTRISRALLRLLDPRPLVPRRLHALSAGVKPPRRDIPDCVSSPQVLSAVEQGNA